MIKKIDVSDLVVGMYIHDLNRSWGEHPFLRNRFRLRTPNDIERVMALGVRYVYIDTALGFDAAKHQSADNLGRQLDDKLQDLGQTLKRRPPMITVQEELLQAKRIVKEANVMVHDILQDCRLGKQVELEKTEPIVTSITESIFRNPDAIISLLRIKQADKYTYQHSVAVATLLISFCRALSIDRAEIELAGIGGLLHDIGKMKVPNYLLNKPGKLSAREFDIMKSHVGEGRLLLENTAGMSLISINIAAEHHERYDGSGYPKGLKGEEISRYGRMAAIVDVYDALTSARIYHPSTEPTAVLKQLLEGAGRHFDTPLVHSFIRTVGIYPVGSLVKLENGEVAVVIEQHHEDLLHPIVRVFFNSRLRSYIRPKNYDLSKPSCHQRIVRFEIPSRWRIEPNAFL